VKEKRRCKTNVQPYIQARFDTPNHAFDAMLGIESEVYMGFFRPPPKEKGIKGALGAESEAVIAAALIQAGYTVCDLYLRGTTRKSTCGMQQSMNYNTGEFQDALQIKR
jgi:hypothetical protein